MHEIHPPRAGEARGIVDELIEERAPELRHKPILWRFVQLVFYPILQYRKAVRLARKIEGADGFAVLDYASRVLKVKMKVEGAQNLPKSGRCLLISNHPTGLADGIAIYDLLIDHRKDFMIFANADALRVVPKFKDVLIPVDLGASLGKLSKTSRLALLETEKAMRNEQMLVVFPSGRLSYLTHKGLTERPWRSSFLKFSERYQAPIIPITMRARNSVLFYLFSFFSREMRDISLFYELLNKKNSYFYIKVGKPIYPQDLPQDWDIERQCQHLQSYVEKGDYRLPPFGIAAQSRKKGQEYV